MPDVKFPPLDPNQLKPTRDALHAYSKIIGSWLKSSRKKRKHWWHASLRPTLNGLSTGVVYQSTDFEVELDLAGSRICVRSSASSTHERLHGQSAAEVAAFIVRALLAAGIDEDLAPEVNDADDQDFPDYAADQAKLMHRVFGSAAAQMQEFRAGVREETSPIQVWPHHFDLSMIWLPGQKIPGEDPADEEQADKQMNFGFVFGDDTITEPYFYVTAYPLPDALPDTELPTPVEWKSDGFNGAVLLYRDIVEMDDPAPFLQGLWSALYEAGKQHLVTSG